MNDSLNSLSSVGGINVLVSIMPNVSDAALREFMEAAYKLIRREMNIPSPLANLRRKYLDIDVDQLASGLLILLQGILRLKFDSYKEQSLRGYLKTLKFNDQCCDVFINEFYENRNNLLVERRVAPYFLRYKSVSWRIDITVSSNFLKRNVDTLIVMQITFINGNKKTFEMTVNKFNHLRFYIASMLSEMLQLKQKSFLK